MSAPFVDAFGRGIKYLRLSVTDRCDLRCRYCMSEAMTFLPSKELLSFDELDRVARCFIAAGVEKIRVTGGEPLVRKEIMQLFRGLSRCLADGRLRELTLTTNGTSCRAMRRSFVPWACGGLMCRWTRSIPTNSR
jgi:GTP 3',8-cyclase